MPDISACFSLGFLQAFSSLPPFCLVFLVLLCLGPGTVFVCGLAWGMRSQVLPSFTPDLAAALAGMRNEPPF